MGEIALSDTLVGGTKQEPRVEPNQPIRVYTDPNHRINLY